VSIWKTLLGGAAGMLVGGPLGALIGAAGGYAADQMSRDEEDGLEDDGGTTTKTRPAADTQGRDRADGTKTMAFTIAAIALGAKMAKADGVVTRDEVEAFKEVFRVPPEEARNVARFFDQAKKDARGFEPYARQLRDLFSDNRPVLEEMIGCLFHIAKADGIVDDSEITYLRKVAEIFGFDDRTFARIQAAHLGPDQNDPYTILGLDHEATDGEVKSQYRRLLRETHPDVLIAQGLPSELIQVATDRMAAINGAYERICRARDIR